MDEPQGLSHKRLRVGVDVGGTNTDSVLIDLAHPSEPDKVILAWHKTPTTSDPSDGIKTALSNLLESTNRKSDIISVAIGTTQFIDAVIERDANRLSRVAVLRLGYPYSKHMRPCSDWSDDLQRLVLGHYALLRGGLQVDGSPIGDVEPAEIGAECALIKQKGIHCVVIDGIFSPLDSEENQEQLVAGIVRQELPGCDVVLSSEVAKLGFIERENAAILNAAILRYARQTLRLFQRPLKQLGLDCPVFITQNDGTVLPGQLAAKFPTRTFSGGPSNSMRGAAFLVEKYSLGKLDEKKPMMVVDIGGTTMDVGLLLPSGFPRQRAAFSNLAGVRMNFSYPDVTRIGLGGGVGRRFTEDAILFGGAVLTATDCAVSADPTLAIGSPDVLMARSNLSPEEIYSFQEAVKSKLEQAIDSMKTSPEDLPVLLVGGGAILAPSKLKGASEVLRLPWSGIVNAIGAAMAGLSLVVDTIKTIGPNTEQLWLEEIKKAAIDKIVAAGALHSSVQIVEMETLPMSTRGLLDSHKYVENKARFIVRATGDFDYNAPSLEVTVDGMDDVNDVNDLVNSADDLNTSQYRRKTGSGDFSRTPTEENKASVKSTGDLRTYKPKVADRVWYLSETDIGWIATGCNILGSGGGGYPFPTAMRLRQMIRDGDLIQVVDSHDVDDKAVVGGACFAGAPNVFSERLPADELLETQKELMRLLKDPITHLNCLEVGGANGMQSFMVGSSSNLDLPTADGDYCGRAYPVLWQTTPYVYGNRQPVYLTMALSDGNGASVIVSQAKSDKVVEWLLRAALSELGSLAGVAVAPASGVEYKRWAVRNTISQSWRIGRAVHLARLLNGLDTMTESIISECGGPDAAKVLWRGKIVSVKRTLRKAHLYGECVIEGEGGDSFNGHVVIPFKNENIAAIKRSPSSGPIESLLSDSEHVQGEVLAVVPDLVAVLDAEDGEGIGTQDYRYGQRVIVIGIAASEQWTGTEEGIRIGGPEGFDMGYLKYRPFGKYSAPKSVINEYNIS
ncbi:hypothetical protein MKX08_002872 [Trichoderma sp. CBMAI-0020]|nr:hypothetical protein MKX08_002872 [Trichoderma sp. CBMAI-0020]WOD45550.1 hypothetical protein [Trichoderma atroviride]